MRINHNIAALNTHRQLSQANNANQQSMEKLSSGLRINRAGDDAAGLAISEKMRGQIRGLEQAERNAQDGISMIQTAEGALNESHSILQRMRELSVQSANDTNTKADRAELQKEVDQLAEEMGRIADNTEFNTQNLLDGSFKGNFQIGANKDQNIEISINKMDSQALNVSGSEAAELEQTASVTGGTGSRVTDGSYEVLSIEDYQGTDLTDAKIDGGIAADVNYVAVDASGEAVITSENGTDWTQYDDAATSGDADTFTLDGNVVEGGSITVGATGTTATATVGIEGHNMDTGTYTAVDVSNNSSISGSWNVGLADENGEIVALGATDTSGTVAADASSTTNWVDVNDTSSSLLDTTANSALSTGDEIKITGKGIDISTQEAANSAIDTIDNALQSVSSERSKLGAYQNRLEHTINNLGTSSENLTAAESRIRDVDMAKEMMNQTKQNILAQASQSMLAKANQQPQGVLQLLR